MGDGERDSSIWSIRPRMRTAYLLTFAALFGGSLAFLAATGHSPETIMERAGSVAIGAAGAAMFLAEGGGYVMVLVDAAIAWRNRKIAGWAEEAREEARAEANQAWRAWHERREDARARGVSFNEPAPDENPPGVNGRAESE